ncbi:hypothetical protein [Helicobacter cetorum]|uniref:Uncharacterized protein n=1 Tax=Helicobacter cetorum (strain ATCC BAA-540 / CCUG 52418 / MIT 99-5656) TaxID=1163745 RepID=I0ERW7_HELCM|nr:hypothetical protein [Helicobacter cetorum]AFI05686.1 hypothetical protein HCD_03350 [Helicobacter cetorum MIT 99-5656]
MYPHLEEVTKGYLRPYITELNLSDTDTKSPKIECLVRKKFVKLTPKEAMHQRFILHLHKSYFYPIVFISSQHSLNILVQNKTNIHSYVKPSHVSIYPTTPTLTILEQNNLC